MRRICRTSVDSRSIQVRCGRVAVYVLSASSRKLSTDRIHRLYFEASPHQVPPASLRLLRVNMTTPLNLPIGDVDVKTLTLGNPCDAHMPRSCIKMLFINNLPSCTLSSDIFSIS
ncbi:hypothetical protein Y032_0016g2951 [Ancylostoma ceylanicum]|uniref:Uncharacterized protein n=1 Tax=Ancylostoma ceylanicum TaxID=53326 RepID=A0A016V7T1_9BILA|nr:hypothetical protein Y032_0016g2951 [Ancylostoma ceylanicum]